MTCLRAVCVALAVFVAYGCSPEPPKSGPHYVLGTSYQVGAAWFYPRESGNLDETGLATVAKNGHPALTSDGEAFDQTALAAAHPTLQLPAIARLTNLENGLQVTVRLNDRGTGDPHRLITITLRTAQLLQITGDAVTRVQLQVLPNESRGAAEGLPGAPSLEMSAVPRQAVEVAELPPPAGVRSAAASPSIGSPAPPLTAADPSMFPTVAPPLRMPEIVTRTAPQPGMLMVRLDTFSEYRYAAAQRARMSQAGAQIVTFKDRRRIQFRVEIGPLQDIAEADAVLDQALASGIPDARIVVQQQEFPS